MHGEKAARIRFGSGANIWEFQGYIAAALAEDVFQKRRLARLPRSDGTTAGNSRAAFLSTGSREHLM